MKKTEGHVPSLPEYEHNEYDFEGMRKLYAKYRQRMKPTSIALPPETINKLKSVAMTRGVPYQVLMRSFVIRGLNESLVEDGRQTPPYRTRPKKKKKA